MSDVCPGNVPVFGSVPSRPGSLVQIGHRKQDGERVTVCKVYDGQRTEPKIHLKMLESKQQSKRSLSIGQ